MRWEYAAALATFHLGYMSDDLAVSVSLKQFVDVIRLGQGVYDICVHILAFFFPLF